MAITIDGVIFRNIQEQVEKNKRDIAAWSNIQFTLNNFGITVLGRVDTEADIPEGTYEYGDAYLVGEEEPYDIYIFTRDSEDGEFINMGPLTVTGPQGEQGPQGPAGTITVGTVTTGAAGTNVIVTNSGTSENAILNFTIPRGNTGAQGSQGEQGPQGATGATGAQGPQGPQGDPGESFMIIGTITNTSQLPDPTTTQRNYAYVYDDGDSSTPNRLYYITGTEGNEQWSYSSLAAAGTTVSVNGNPVSTWNADTKQDVLTASSVTSGTVASNIGFDSNGDLVKEESKRYLNAVMTSTWYSQSFSAAWTNIAIDKFESVISQNGTGLSLSSGKVIVGANVSKIMVTCAVSWNRASAMLSQSFNIGVTKNGVSNVIVEVGLSPDGGNQMSTVIPTIIDVQENDEISLACWVSNTNVSPVYIAKVTGLFEVIQ